MEQEHRGVCHSSSEFKWVIAFMVIHSFFKWLYLTFFLKVPPATVIQFFSSAFDLSKVTPCLPLHSITGQENLETFGQVYNENVVNLLYSVEFNLYKIILLNREINHICVCVYIHNWYLYHTVYFIRYIFIYWVIYSHRNSAT